MVRRGAHRPLSPTQAVSRHRPRLTMPAQHQRGTSSTSTNTGGGSRHVRNTGAGRSAGSTSRVGGGGRGGRGRSAPQPPPAAAPQAPRLSTDALLAFERRGFTVTRGLLPPAQLQPVKQAVQDAVEQQKLQALKHRIRVLCPPEVAAQADGISSSKAALHLLANHGSCDLGFLQFFNLHRTNAAIDALVRDRRLASTAGQLLGAKRLRLYQSCVFLKEPGYAETNWHSDLRMAPLDCNHFVTAWMPLRPVQGGEQDSGLVFAVGSHRDFALPFWHDIQGRDLSDRGYPLADTGAMAVGDVSWHHGWLLHAAPPQPRHTRPRIALTASYYADDDGCDEDGTGGSHRCARTLARRSDASVRAEQLHDEDAESYSGWLREVPEGAPARHALLPLVLP